MRENFKPSLKFTLQFEGGYVNHPKDPGGHTNKGVTLATLRRFKPGATVADLKAISDDLVERIYRAGYWTSVMGDRLAAGVDGATFDYGVNSGPAAALKSLRAVVGGPDHVTVKRLCARRLSIYQTFRHWKTFGKGWTRRVTAGEALWVKWALAAQNDTVVVTQQLDDEAAAAKKKAANQNRAGGTTGAATTGGTAASQADPAIADQVAGWLIAGMLAAGLALAAWLLWRAWLNRQRARAYAAEASAT